VDNYKTIVNKGGLKFPQNNSYQQKMLKSSTQKKTLQYNSDIKGRQKPLQICCGDSNCGGLKTSRNCMG